MKRVVILGGGSGGAVAASRLGKWARPGEFEVVLIDRSEWHEFRPSYLWVAVGKREPDEIRRPLAALERRYGTRVMRATVTGIRPETQTVETDQGNRVRLPDCRVRGGARADAGRGWMRGPVGACPSAGTSRAVAHLHWWAGGGRTALLAVSVSAGAV